MSIVELATLIKILMPRTYKFSIEKLSIGDMMYSIKSTETFIRVIGYYDGSGVDTRIEMNESLEDIVKKLSDLELEAKGLKSKVDNGRI